MHYSFTFNEKNLTEVIKIVSDSRPDLIKRIDEEIIYSGTFGQSFVDFISLDDQTLKDFDDNLLDDISLTDLELLDKVRNSKDIEALTKHIYFRSIEEDFKPDTLNKIITSLVIFKTYIDACNKDEKNKLFSLSSFACFMSSYSDTDYTTFPGYRVKVTGQAFPKETDNEIDWYYLYLNEMTKKTLDISNVYNCNNFNELLTASLYELLKKGLIIKKCLNCDKYFVPFNRSDTIYCDRQSPQDSSKNCKEYGKYKTYQENLRKNDAEILRKNIYNAKLNKSKRCNNQNSNLKNDLENFIKDSNKWKKDVKSGIKTTNEFIEWMKIQERKV